MKEIIESIKEGTWDDDEYPSFEGLIVKTNLQDIKIGISSGQSCCEDFGGILTNDDPNYFLGSEILGIKLTDTALKTTNANNIPYDFECGGIQFVDIETDRGSLQYAVYNSHNGYYGHDITVKSIQLNHSGDL